MRNNKTKVIAIVALMVAVVGLGIGFAAFSSTLTIESGATVTPNKSDWNVHFKDISCGFNRLGSAVTSEEAEIISEGTLEDLSISGIEAVFKTKGFDLSCNYTIINEGKYNAYLTNMDIDGDITCEAIEDTENP